MSQSGTIAIVATDKKYFGLKHMPGALALDANGEGVWPADQFTFRLIQEGAIREQSAAAAQTAPAAPATPAAAPNPLSHLRELVDEAQTELNHVEAAAPAPAKT
jgi:hypothetical protein